MADIRELGVHSKATMRLVSEHITAFECLQDRFKANVPKRFQVVNSERPVVVFTDGSYETDDITGPAKVGAVLSRRKTSGKEHLIGQMELYGVLVARDLWKETRGEPSCSVTLGGFGLSGLMKSFRPIYGILGSRHLRT